MAKPHIIIVHGAFHRPWHFHLLQQRLEHAGYRVTVPDLPSTSDEPPEKAALAIDAETIRFVMEIASAGSTSILPVFHSYGGVAGSEALAQLSLTAANKINRVVFLASFVVERGTTVEEMMGIKLPPGTGENVCINSEGWIPTIG
jgi:pimeloyl-ACP methyl ester carboxylesterase